MQSAKMAVFIHKYEYMGITKNIHPCLGNGECICLQWIKAGSVEGQILSADLAAELGVGFWCKTQV